MKNGTLYAKRVRKLFTRLKNEHGKPEVPQEPTAPLEQLILALLAIDSSETKAHKAINALRTTMVDINEVRVSTCSEVADAIEDHVPDSEARADEIRTVLNAVFRREHAVSLDSLHKIGLREAKHYLEELGGVDHSAVASVLLWSLGGHAIPVTRRMHEALRREKCAEPAASRGEVQAFLERNISSDDAKMFCILMNKLSAAPSPRGSAKGAAAGSARQSKPVAKSKAKKPKKKASPRKTSAKAKKGASR